MFNTKEWGKHEIGLLSAGSNHADEIIKSAFYRLPCGMLDRDQRTTLSIRKRDRLDGCCTANICDYKMHRELSSNECNCNKSQSIHGNNNETKNSCKWQKDTQSILPSKCSIIFRGCKAHTFFKAKSINQFLLVLVIATLLPLFTALPISPQEHRLLLHAQQHRQKQISHQQQRLHQHQHNLSLNMNKNSQHHSSSSSTGVTNENLTNKSPNDKSFCQLLNERLNQTLKQSEMSYSYIRNLMDIYTMAEFKKMPQEVYKEWAAQPLHFNHEIEKHMQDDFDKLPTPAELEHLSKDSNLSRTELTEEMRKIYLSLNTLKHVFEDITNDRNHNHSQILHDLLGNTKAHSQINTYFSTSHNYIKADLNEASLVMDDLNIAKPSIATTIPQYNSDLQRRNREWLSAKEYLKVLQYIRAIYRYFLDKTCIEQN